MRDARGEGGAAGHDPASHSLCSFLKLLHEVGSEIEIAACVEAVVDHQSFNRMLIES